MTIGILSKTSKSSPSRLDIDNIDEWTPISESEKQYYDAVRKECGENASEEECIRITRSFRNDKKDRMGKTIECAKLITKWRHDNNVDGILNEKIENSSLFKNSWVSRTYGQDKQGHLIMAERLSDIKLDVIQQNFSIEQIIRHRIQHMEQIQAEKCLLSKKTGKMVYKHIYIFDLKDAGIKHASKLAVDYLKPIFELGQVYYPESLYRMYLVNAPVFFYGVWKVFSALIDPETKEKIQVIKNSIQFIEIATKHGIPMESLPDFLGGNHNGRLLDIQIPISNEQDGNAQIKTIGNNTDSNNEVPEEETSKPTPVSVNV